MTFRTRAVACAAALVLVPGLLSGCGQEQDAEAPEETPTTEEDTVADSPDAPGNTEFTGTWVDPDGNGYLTFDDRGNVRGSDACNGIGTTFTVDDASGAATLEPFATTMMACPEGWSQWLLQVTTVEHHGDRLTVLGREGEEVGILVPGEEPAG